jgi:tRNA modification GTPase
MKGAVAVIRISGDESLSILNRIFTREVKESHKVYYGYIINKETNEKIDEVMVSYFKGPRSFTGEDVVEISCHGSLIIVNQIIELCIKYGARISERGEFSSRAFYNGRIDLVQAEAINSLINAETLQAKRLQLFSLSGQTSSLIYPIKEKLADILSLIEVNIDYPEYQDIEEMTTNKIIEEVDPLITEINSLIKSGERSKLINSGINVAIVGRPNVGKSSLLNALLKQDKAIVTNIPGTTRDVVEGKVNLNGLVLNLLDTAGIRNSDDEVEKIGIEKSKQIAEQADLVLLVLEADKTLKEDEELLDMVKDYKHLVVYNKKELVQDKAIKENSIYISALNKDIGELEGAIHQLFNLEEMNNLEPSLCSSREIGLLNKVKENLLQAKEEAIMSLSLDLVAISLKEAYDSVKNILGEETSVDLEKEIFSRFCLGK